MCSLGDEPRSPFGSWIRRECHRKGGIVEARLKSYSKAAAVLCIAHITTVIGELLPWRDSQTSNCIWGNQDLSRSIFISNHFQGGSSQTKISSQNTFLEDLGLAIWQRTFDKKSCKVLLLRAADEDNESNLDIAAVFRGPQNSLWTCFSLQNSSHSISMRTIPANRVPKRISEGDTNLFIPTSAW